MKKNKTTKPKKKTSAAARLGQRGGLSVSKKRGKRYMKQLGKRGAEARWGARELEA